MYTKPKHESKTCPRCQADFECKTGSILLCQCQTILLTEQQMAYINAQYDDCLCLACLQALRTEYNCRQHERKIRKYLR
jgi:hypothetical protein